MSDAANPEVVGISGRPAARINALPQPAAFVMHTGDPSHLYYRHTLAVRIMHWINVIAVTILFMSGLNIFSAHPALYWGKSSYTGRGPVFQITSHETDEDQVVGVTRLFSREVVTTGVLGAVAGGDGATVARTFPSWITLPDDRWLSMARRWHFFFAWVFVINGLCYLVYTLAGPHLRRDLSPTRADWRSVGHSIADHLRLRHARGEAALRYNVLQKLSYLVVIFLLLPGIFVVASLISLAIGTSMGTIAAVVPIALGVADASGLDRALVLGAVIGGAMFGDNLSVISDTTIAATRSQGAEMRD